jgi:hypothetical protein
MGMRRKDNKNKKWWVPRLEGGMEGLQEWRVGVGIWRSMENGGPYRGPAGVDFFPKPPNFGVEAPTEVALSM